MGAQSSFHPNLQEFTPDLFFQLLKRGSGCLGVLSVIFWDRLPVWPVSFAWKLFF